MTIAADVLEEAARFAKKQGSPQRFVDLMLEVTGVRIRVWGSRSSGTPDRNRIVSYTEIERAKFNILVEWINLTVEEFEKGVTREVSA